MNRLIYIILGFTIALNVFADSISDVLEREYNTFERIIKTSNLEDTLKGKPYCIYFCGGCWPSLGLVVTIETDRYRLYAANHWNTPFVHTLSLPLDDKRVTYLFAYSNRDVEYDYHANEREHLGYQTFGIFDSTNETSFYWTSLCCSSERTDLSFIPICMNLSAQCIEDHDLADVFYWSMPEDIRASIPEPIITK